MELSLESRPAAARRLPPRKRARAAWWFARMREAVDHAFDWQPAPAGRPEQIWMQNLLRHPAGPWPSPATATSERNPTRE